MHDGMSSGLLVSIGLVVCARTAIDRALTGAQRCFATPFINRRAFPLPCEGVASGPAATGVQASLQGPLSTPPLRAFAVFFAIFLAYVLPESWNSLRLERFARRRRGKVGRGCEQRPV